VVGAALREPMSQTRIAAVIAGTGSQPRFEEQDRASQITARLIRNGQAHRAMRVKFPARFFNRLTRTTTGKQCRMIFSTRTFESRRSSAATHVAPGDVADQLEVSCILNHRPRSRSLNHASLAGHMPPNLATYSTNTLRMVSSHRYYDSHFFLLHDLSNDSFSALHYSLVSWRLSSTPAEVLYCAQ
jgi:hypothetical protein